METFGALRIFVGTMSRSVMVKNTAKGLKLLIIKIGLALPHLICISKFGHPCC